MTSAYARLFDLCEDRGWQLEIATKPNQLVLEIRGPRVARARLELLHTFRVPPGRTIEEAATALLHELYAETETGGTP